MTVQPGFAVAIGTTVGLVIAADPTRKKITITNDSYSQIVYLGLGIAASIGNGVRLAPQGDYWETTYTGAIYAIATAAGANVIGAGA